MRSQGYLSWLGLADHPREAMQEVMRRKGGGLGVWGPGSLGFRVWGRV